MNRWLGLGLLLIAVGALALRCPQLDLRPLHNDEAVNADKIKGLLDKGLYAYDPNEHHGPTLLYATLPFVWLSGAQDYAHLSESTLRAVSVFFGVSLILLLVLLADGLGRKATIAAAILTAIAPSMVFYSRYFIHEMLLVSFTLLTIGAGWRYANRPSLLWATTAGLGVGLMYATKETFVIPTAAMGMALLATRSLNARFHLAPPLALRWNLAHALVALVAAIAISLVLFTSFFTNAAGPIDSLRTYAPWLKRAGGDSPHIHPWYFYLQRLVYFHEKKGPVWTEGLIVLLACVGSAVAFRRHSEGHPLSGGGGSGPADLERSPLTKDGLARPTVAHRYQVQLVLFLAIYTLLVATAYSLISYKTPWCMLGFSHPLLLLAGVGSVAGIRSIRQRTLQYTMAALLMVGAGHLVWQAYRANFVYAADRRNPYVYAQTLPDLLNLVRQVHELAQEHPDRNQMLIKVMTPDSDYWPLPWYLRDLQRIGWWDRLPADPYAPVMVVGAKWQAALDERSEKKWLMVRYFELRPKTFLELYVEASLWEKYINARQARPTVDE